MTIILRSPWTRQPSSFPGLNPAFWPGNSCVILPSRGETGVYGAAGITGANANAPFSRFGAQGRELRWRTNSSTDPGEYFTWQTGDYNIGANGSMIAIMAGPYLSAPIRASFSYGGTDWGLSLQLTSTTVSAIYVDAPPTAAFTATLSSLPTLADGIFRAVGLTKQGTTIKAFCLGRMAATTGGNGGIRRSAGSGIGHTNNADIDGIGASTLIAVTSAVLSDDIMHRLTRSVESAWQLFAPRRIIIPGVAAVSAGFKSAWARQNSRFIGGGV